MTFSFVRFFVVLIIHFTEVRTLRIVDQRWRLCGITNVRRDTCLEVVRPTSSEGMEPQQPRQRKSAEGSSSKVRGKKDEGYFLLLVYLVRGLLFDSSLTKISNSTDKKT